jgi:hypothetical protein
MADRSSDVARTTRTSGTSLGRASGVPAERMPSHTQRRAGVFKRALRREVSRLHEPRRIVAIAIIVVVASLIGAGIVARGELAGADARAYWAGVRTWLSGGNPYYPTGPFLPYVYAPWMLPLFAPWALLPWDVAWFVWRGIAIILLLWTADWAYRRKPLATAVAILLLAFPLAANLDTGNITLILTFMLWACRFVGPSTAGFLWGLATWMKWVPAPFWLILAPRARGWGIVWLLACMALSLATLPLTIIQLQALFGFGTRPPRLDYLVLLWATIPWLWQAPDPLSWLRPANWRRWIGEWRAAPRARFRRFVGLEG